MFLNIGFTGVALLLALLASALPALVHRQHWFRIRESWRAPLRLAFGVLSEDLGASILYTTPAGGTPSATPLTAAQAQQTQVQIAQVTLADADTTIPFVTNWGLPNSFPTFGYPEIIYYWLAQTASPSSFQTAFTFGIANTNQVTINKTSVGTGSGGVLQVILRRPHSVGQ